MKKLLSFITFVFFNTATGFSQYTNLHNFKGNPDGANPQYGELYSDGTYLYGMTQGGGIYNSGTLFKIKPDGTNYTKIFDFTNGIGNPNGSLISDGTFLYGMTYNGGTTNYGTIFKIKPDGTNFTTLHDFTGGINGEHPNGSLISNGSFLYGMTMYGGTSSKGTIFKIKPDGTNFTKLLDFTGANGYYPTGSLISDGSFLYGMTKEGGVSNMGILFKIKPDGTNYTKLLDFTGIANGSYPFGSLILDGTFLYGMTLIGGASDMGTIFKIKSDGTNYTKLLNFTGAANGYYPYGSLIIDGAFLYGMTHSGGSGMGILFKIKQDGTNYTKLLDFAGTSNGSSPYGSLILDGAFLYGMTYQGGTFNFGNIFNYLYCAPNTGSVSTTICNNDSIVVNGTTYNAGNLSGTEVFENGGANGCDSIVTINLNVLPALTGSVNNTICYNKSIVINGTTYNASNPSGTEVFENGGANGCDSIVTVNLTVLAAIDATVSNVSPTLTANQTSASYKWLDCVNGNAIIASEISKSFTATLNGNYAVEITVGSCVDTSGCENITFSGIDEIAKEAVFIYPNPTNGLFTISLSSLQSKNTNYAITTIEGRIIETAYTSLNTITIDLSNESQGIYLLKIKGDAISNVYKIIKQ